jgi:hypothetical protein
MLSRTRNGADPRPLSLPDIYAISGESVLAHARNRRELAHSRADFMTQTA